MLKQTMVALVALVVGSTLAHADAAEFFKCKMKEGTTFEQLSTLANDFEALAAEKGLTDYEISFLLPIYSSSLGRGNFYWVGVSNDLASAGHANDIWEDDISEPIRNRWQELVKDCDSSSLHTLIRTPQDN